MTDAPLISVVIPVYGVRQYLAECLDSVLGSPGSGEPGAPSAAAGEQPARIEVIAVDDASADGCGVLLDDRASADDRLTVVHLDANRGPGNARNVGLARAKGRYVWFIDGDDLIPAGAIAAVGCRLAAISPDVLLIGYQDLYPDGGTAPGPGADLLRSAPSGTFRLADAPTLVNLTMTSWSKVLRRDFLIDLDEPFRPGIHEDVPVTCAALLAGRLGTLAQICYSYRRSRPGSFMASRDSGHLAIFDAYDEVFGLLDKRLAADDPAVTEAVRAAVFERAIWHYASVLQAGFGIGPLRHGGMVPRRGRRAFFSRMHADFVRHVPAGYRHPPGPRGAKLRLVERDAYVSYEVLEPLNQLRVALRRALRGAGHGSRQS